MLATSSKVPMHAPFHFFALPFFAGVTGATGGGGGGLACDMSESTTFQTTAQALAAATCSEGGTKRKFTNWKGTHSFQLDTITGPRSRCSFGTTWLRSPSAAVSLRERG